MEDTFPYGNDLRHPEDWVGMPDTKSKRYLVAYVGGHALNFIWNSHTVIFFGLESLSVAVFDLTSLGFQIGVGPSKLVQLRNAVGDALDAADDGIRRLQTHQDSNDLDQIYNPYNLYRVLSANALTIEMKRAVSFNELNSSSGKIVGGEIEFYGKAAGYEISAGSERGRYDYFDSEPVLNVGSGGTIGANVSVATGIWVADRILSAYWMRDGTPSAPERPFTAYPSIVSYLQLLPPPGETVPDFVVDMGKEYAEGSRVR